MKKKGNKPITSFNIWLGRNVIYNKKQLIKRQNAAKTYIEQNNLGSQQLREMGKKQFVRELHSRCQIPIGPLNLLYDDLPIDSTSNYTSNEIVEFISNYLYQLRSNNIERIRDRCISSNINDEQFTKHIVLNKNNELANFLKNSINIKNNYKINELVPKIQQYAQNLYRDIDIIGNKTEENKQNDDNNQDDNERGTFGSWLSELCHERGKLTKQQELIEQYIKNNENNINSINDINEWDFRKLLINQFKIKSIDTTVIMEKLFVYHKTENKLDSKDKLIEIIKKILYDIRRDNMNSIISKCSYSAKMGIDDDYFLTDIVVNDNKLEKFLIHNLCIGQINEISKLIENIRKYLKELKIIHSDDEKKQNAENAELLGTQTIYGNKLGRWIGEIIHDRLLYLKYSKKVYDFIIVNHWNSGILPHVGKKMFIDKLKKRVFTNLIDHNNKYNKLLNGIWDRLRRRYINTEIFNASPHEVGSATFEYMREIRRSNIYQIAVECIKDSQCIDAKTFYTKIGSNKNALRKFIDKILRNTNQINLISNAFGKELVVEKIYYLLSVDVEDNNILFENWLSNLIYDPVTLWLNLAEVNNFLIEENVNDSRVKMWGKNTFIEKASVQCNSLNSSQLSKLYDISRTRSNKEDIYNSITEKLKHKNNTLRNKYNNFIEEKNMNKSSFLTVTAINIDKLIEFIDKDLGIKFDEKRDFVNHIIEKLRLCLKIHTNLFNQRFDDDLKTAQILFSIDDELKIDGGDEKELKNDNDDNDDIDQQYNKWVTPNMLDLKNFNKYQLSLAICYKLLQNKQFEVNMSKTYRNLSQNIMTKKKNKKDFQFDGSYLCKFILSAKAQFDFDKTKQNEMVKEEIQKQEKDPWKYKNDLTELKAPEITYLVKECLLNTNYIPNYKNKIDNISKKIIDTNINGYIFVTNLNLDKNIFVHRMMECFGDKSNHKFVTKLYDDLTNPDILKNITADDIKNYGALELSNYLKTYQIVKIQNMIIEQNIDGKEFCKLKRHQFAKMVKEHSDLGIGVATMLYKKMKTFKFIKPINDAQEIDNKDDKNDVINRLKDSPSIEFVSLITKTLEINSKTLCIELWNNLIEKYNKNELKTMNENETMRYIYGYQINSFYTAILSKINDEHEQKNEIIKTLIQQRFEWLNDDIKYGKMYDNFQKYIGEYFKSELILIIFYREKFDLLKDDGIKFLLMLDYYNITYNKLYNKQKEIDTMIQQYKSQFDQTTVNNIVKEIKLFIQEQKKCDTKQNADWTSHDIGMYLIKEICNQIGLIRNNLMINNSNKDIDKLCVFDILFCIKYLSNFMDEVMYPLNNMPELMIRKSKNQSIYDINDNNNIPEIVKDIFVTWITNKVPDKPSKSNKKGGFLSNIFNTFS